MAKKKKRSRCPYQQRRRDERVGLYILCITGWVTIAAVVVAIIMHEM